MLLIIAFPLNTPIKPLTVDEFLSINFLLWKIGNYHCEICMSKSFCIVKSKQKQLDPKTGPSKQKQCVVRGKQHNTS